MRCFPRPHPVCPNLHHRQASSGPAATTAIAVLSLVSVVDALASAEAAIPLYLRRRTNSYGSLAFNKIVSNVFGSGRAGKKPDEEGGGGDGGSPRNGPKPQLHALVLTKNREIAAGVTVSETRLCPCVLWPDDTPTHPLAGGEKAAVGNSLFLDRVEQGNENTRQAAFLGFLLGGGLLVVGFQNLGGFISSSPHRRISYLVPVGKVLVHDLEEISQLAAFGGP